MASTPTSVVNLPEETWVKAFLTVPNEAERIVTFAYDKLQSRMARADTIRNVWVKPRQVRCSSRIMARNVRRVTNNFGTNCLVIGKDDDMIARFRSRIKHHLDDLRRVGQCPEVTEDNSRELVFGSLEGSRFIWASAEQKVAGRSFTAHVVHATEVAHWPAGTAGEILGGILPAVPDPPLGQVDLESTPNGAAGPFYDFAMSAQWEGANLEDDYALHFYKWWDEPKYAKPTTEEDWKTFTPTEEEQSLIQTHSLSIGQILWRRSKMREMSKTGTPFEQEYPEDLMGCFLLGGNSYFEVEVLKYLMGETKTPVKTYSELKYHGDVVKFEGWGENMPGRAAPWVMEGLIVYEEPKPGEDYVIFGDPSEGHKNSDNACYQVLHASSRRQVATVAFKTPPNRFGEMGCALGAYYNNALLAIERNRISAAVLKAIDLDYPNLYYDVDEEDPTRIKRKAGWYTTRDSRLRILSTGKEDVETFALTIRDQPTVREMYSFGWEQVRKTGDLQWKAQAQAGAMDDRVIALMGANHLADQVILSTPESAKGRKPKGPVSWL